MGHPISTRDRTGTIAGVIGRYQRGGDTSAISYSAYLGTAVHQVAQQAITDAAAAG